MVKSLLPRSKTTCDLILKAVENGLAIAELECMGVSSRTINALNSHKCIFVKDLFKLSIEEISSCGIGELGIKELRKSFQNFSEFEKRKNRTFKSLDRVRMYKSKINTKYMLG